MKVMTYGIHLKKKGKPNWETNKSVADVVTPTERPGDAVRSHSRNWWSGDKLKQ